MKKDLKTIYIISYDGSIKEGLCDLSKPDKGYDNAYSIYLKNEYGLTTKHLFSGIGINKKMLAKIIKYDTVNKINKE